VILNGYFIPVIIDTEAELNIVSNRLIRNTSKIMKHPTLLLTAENSEPRGNKDIT